VTWERYFGEIARRERLIDDAGVPRCGWIATHTDYDSAPDAPTIERMVLEAEAHKISCAVCKARREYAAMHFAPLPSPPRWWRSHSGSITAFPPWVIPAVIGAIGVGGITAVRVIVALFGASRMSVGMGLAAVGLGIVTGGVAGGSLHSVARALLSKLGEPGDYLTGILLMAGYVAATLAAGALLPGKLAMSAVVLVGLTVIFGLAAARAWRSVFRARS
jgi:hypothetical protein